MRVYVAMLSALRAICTAMLATFLVFCALRLALPDASSSLLGRHADALAKSTLQAQLHHDQDLLAAFGSKLGEFARGEFGTSFRSGVSIREQLFARVSVSLMLLLPGIVIAHIVSLLIISRRWDSPFIWFFAALLSAGGMLLIALGVQYGGAWFKVTHVRVLSTCALALVLTAQLLPLYSPILRGTDAEQVRRANGALGFSKLRGELTVLRVHALPLLTLAVGSLVVQIFAGAVVLESVFNIPGMGLWVRDSALSLDAPVLLAVTAVATLAVSVSTAALRLSEIWLDPRVGQYRAAG